MRKLCFSFTDSGLKARRLKWWQTMAREPERHAQSLAALLCCSKCELQPSVDEQGRLTDWASPWARKSVLQRLDGILQHGQRSYHENALHRSRLLRCLRLALLSTASSPTFTPPAVFVILRAARFAVSIPPPGVEAIVGPSEGPQIEKTDEYECEDTPGEPCGLLFSVSPVSVRSYETAPRGEVSYQHRHGHQPVFVVPRGFLIEGGSTPQYSYIDKKQLMFGRQDFVAAQAD